MSKYMNTKSEIIDFIGDSETGNELLQKLDMVISRMESTKFEVMSSSEEVKCIIDDIFDGDVMLEQSCVDTLCNSYGVAYSNAYTQEIEDLIIDHEDELYDMVRSETQQETSVLTEEPVLV